MYNVEEKRVVSNAHSCFFAVVIIIIIAFIRIYNSSRSAQRSMRVPTHAQGRKHNTPSGARFGVRVECAKRIGIDRKVQLVERQ